MNLPFLLAGSLWPLALIQAIALLAVAPLFTGLSRVMRARMHNRQGPGVLQEYRDIAKLLKRQSVAPMASGVAFRSMPYLLTGGLLVIATALPMVTLASPIGAAGDVITAIYLFAVVRFVFAIAGLDTGSTFTGIGASREAVLGVLVEPILLLGLWIAALVAGSTSLSAIASCVRYWPQSSSLTLILAGLACAFATYIEMGKLPFDMAEAEQELQEGPLTEYSGAALGVLKIGISLKQWVVLQLFLGLFFPFGLAEHITPLSLLVAVVLCLLKLLIAIFLVSLIENSVARLRFLKTSRTTWAGFGLAFLALVSWLVAG
ncbi:respiratory chain complex I subunit 1 family protein [Yersinia ruckeri]|uniref:respiratory chain complex I subunit 1 family protein n=1 Tax=Yersinia ruckeri TaxID=29486 RepID=UPI002237595F|nr:respiratory chain complex I subunit 1 family protein [Yersinia ruckeri]EKN3360395.1 respiratory chain complex I subunit 1 family protein [Yersinia ruckeri]EKN4200133.1 respiratory chain complex I subunit 1 family protein [Yersinia ruckeri]EKN4698483.1 respiratory chain complex I subunit 1 family protein [Yersinia ruckeri]EKN4724566.1 respiratory chain complex I subunit 1 family protein [Yersinia ruckeri]ELV7520198.1 respiratory chain complex I subunit 1 family protein [Yersinia ruckeri]